MIASETDLFASKVERDRLARRMTAPAVTAEMEWEETLLPAGSVPAELEAEVRRQFGAVPSWVARVAPAPWVVRAWATMVTQPVAHLPPGIGDLAALVVSQHNSCRYCFGAQRAVLRMLGYREAYIARLERDFHVAELSDAERAALDFARRMSRADPRPARAERERLAQVGFTAPAVAELAFVAAAIVFANRAATLLALPPDPLEQMVDRPLVRLLRPVIARRMRSKPRRPEPLPEPNEGPFASVVAALEGSPAAGVLRRAIDGALASPVLPRRTKMLLFAVVARALGCTRTESEMRAALALESLGTADVEGILATLASSRLDARETRLVPFARETVRYHRIAAVQRRMREVARGLEPAEIVETVGLLALANAVCRLSVLLDAA